MSKMYKILLAIFVVSSISFHASAQQYWSSRTATTGITPHKAVARQSFPREFKLFDLSITALRQQLFSITDQSSKRSTIITLPNTEGKFEQFEVFEASNFEPALQAKFPDIRAFSGRGITDKFATLKLSISPQGIQTMVFRTDTQNEFIEPFSEDNKVYAVFKSSREKGKLPWTCTTQDQQIVSGINQQLLNTNIIESSTGEHKTIRLAQSCNGEYSNWFGAFNASQVALVLAAYNATLSRCNGCYEKDLALHLNLIPQTVDVIFYDPLTDPYTTMGQWNNQLQATLTAIIGEANYDIGHMFGASGGGGNAGCIGCVCVDNQKGRGITSPADGIPQGDNFDIDYVAHEVGHQIGGNHTFSFSLEGTGANKEVGSGITIMGYAGITSVDVAPHSIDVFHEHSIFQIQANLATKTCPITTSMAGNNATPVVNPVSPFTIPISTPFVLTGVATDADGDPLTYCWEQDDLANGTVTGSNSVAFPTKLVGPNWLTWPATSTGTRYFPRLTSILAGSNTTGPLPGGDAIATTEALSSVSRTLNFRLTVRDNHPFTSTPPLTIGQTQFTDVTITVTNSSGPFAVTQPNTAVSWAAGSSQTVTWSVNNTTSAPVSCANVNILFSSDGGQTFPTVLVSNTPNDGTESITVPNAPTSQARIKVESVGNIFFDIGNANFTVTAPVNGWSFTSPPPAVSSCPAGASMAITLGTTVQGTFTNPITLSASGNPGGTTVSFAPTPLTPGNSTVVTLNGTNTLNAGSYTITVTGTATGFPAQTRDIVYTINPGTAPTISVQPSPQTVCSGAVATFSVTASGATAYQWEVSTNGGGNWNPIGGATASTYNTPATTVGMNGNLYRVIASAQCGSITSASALLTVNAPPAISTQPSNATICAGSNNTFSVVATGGSLSYQWELSTNGGGTWNPIGGATAASYQVTGATVGMNGYQYRVVVTGGCPPAVTSNAATLTVVAAPTISAQPANATACTPTPGTASFSVTGSGTSILYQWELSINGGGTWNNVTNGTNYAGATTATLNISGATTPMSGYQFRVRLSNATCTSPVISNAATLTVNTIPSIGTNPSAVTLCSGSNHTFSVTASGTGLTYQWQSSPDGTNWSNIAGATSSTYSLTSIPAGSDGTRYRVIVSGACPPSVTSAGALLTVVSPPSITTQPTDKTICATGNTSFDVVGAGAGTLYQWQVSTDGGVNWNNIPGATSATLNLNNVDVSMNNYRYRVLLSNTTCTTPVTSNPARLQVDARPTVTLSAPLTSLLPGRVSTITASITPPPATDYTITWYRNNVVIPGITGTSYDVNVTRLGDYKVSVVQTATGCNNESAILNIKDSASKRLFVFPSPNDGRFTVSYHNPGGAATQQTLAVYDSRGIKVYHRKLSVVGPYQLHDLDLRPVARGIYYVVLGDPSGKRLADAKVIIH